MCKITSFIRIYWYKMWISPSGWSLFGVHWTLVPETVQYNGRLKKGVDSLLP